NYYADSPERNPQGPDSGEKKVIHGGSWDNGEFGLRGMTRSSGFPDYGTAHFGFRCLLSPGS
ncbi:MAG: hypothetical protein ACK2UK_09865, partial [Candidatus Promineifilaceae bacterium]